MIQELKEQQEEYARLEKQWEEEKKVCGWPVGDGPNALSGIVTKRVPVDFIFFLIFFSFAFLPLLSLIPLSFPCYFPLWGILSAANE